MVFSSVPVYLDPHNWPQQVVLERITTSHSQCRHFRPVESGVTGTIASSIKPGSMAERARLAKLPQPEAVLKCPDVNPPTQSFATSITTAFPASSLLQDLPSVLDSGRSSEECPGWWRLPEEQEKQGKEEIEISVTIDQPQAVASSSKRCCTTDMVGNLLLPPPQVPFLPSLPHLSDYAARDIGSNFAGIQLTAAATGGGNGGTNLEFQMDSFSSGGVPVLSRFAEQWRLQQQEAQQFPILAGLDPQFRIYPFEGEGVGVDQIGSKQLDSAVTMKMEENQGFNLSRNFLGVQEVLMISIGVAIMHGVVISLVFSTSSTSHLL